MGGVLKLNNIRSGNPNVVEWDKVGYKEKGGELIEYPLRVWQNLECILNKHNIEVKLNLVSHDIDYKGMVGSDSRNGKLTDIYALQIEEGLNLSRDETLSSIKRIAENHSYNPFVNMLEANENKEYLRIKELFNVLELNDDNISNHDFYYKLFVKWCLNVVKMAHNTLENDFSGQGVLVLQGGQGCFKSTFCRNLIPQKELFKGDKTLDPEKTDSIMQNTKYILVEWGELDHTMKAEQSKLKQYITATNDEYRSPYDKLSEKYPRITSYIGTVNKKDFLKDETGSRRFWIIPIKKCDIKALEFLDIEKFWGAVYSVWKEGSIKDYLTDSDIEILNKINQNYNFVSDISITLDDKLDWDSPIEEWEVYNATEICSF